MKYSVVLPNESVDVVFERTEDAPHEIRATIGDRTYSLEVITGEPGVYLMNGNQQSIEVFVIPSGDSYSVSIGAHRIPVEILDSRKKLVRTARSGRSGHGGAADILAPMPGKIVRVLVSEGMDVEANQGIVVMEAMKMQNEIKSPKHGKIQKLAVTEGATVRSGDLIAVVDGEGKSN